MKTLDGLGSLTLEQLQCKLKEHDLNIAGKKHELITRLKNYYHLIERLQNTKAPRKKETEDNKTRNQEKPSATPATPKMIKREETKMKSPVQTRPQKRSVAASPGKKNGIQRPAAKQDAEESTKESFIEIDLTTEGIDDLCPEMDKMETELTKIPKYTPATPSQVPFQTLSQEIAQSRRMKTNIVSPLTVKELNTEFMQKMLAKCSSYTFKCTPYTKKGEEVTGCLELIFNACKDAVEAEKSLKKWKPGVKVYSCAQGDSAQDAGYMSTTGDVTVAQRAACTIVLKNIPPSATEKQILELYHGHTAMISSDENGKPLGRAYVEFLTEEAALEAVWFGQGKMIDQSKLEVFTMTKQAAEKKPSSKHLGLQSEKVNWLVMLRLALAKKWKEKDTKQLGLLIEKLKNLESLMTAAAVPGWRSDVNTLLQTQLGTANKMEHEVGKLDTKGLSSRLELVRKKLMSDKDESKKQMTQKANSKPRNEESQPPKTNKSHWTKQDGSSKLVTERFLKGGRRPPLLPVPGRHSDPPPLLPEPGSLRHPKNRYNDPPQDSAGYRNNPPRRPLLSNDVHRPLLEDPKYPPQSESPWEYGRERRHDRQSAYQEEEPWGGQQIENDETGYGVDERHLPTSRDGSMQPGNKRSYPDQLERNLWDPDAPPVKIGLGSEDKSGATSQSNKTQAVLNVLVGLSKILGNKQSEQPELVPQPLLETPVAQESPREWHNDGHPRTWEDERRKHEPLIRQPPDQFHDDRGYRKEERHQPQPLLPKPENQFYGDRGYREMDRHQPEQFYDSAYGKEARRTPEPLLRHPDRAYREPPAEHYDSYREDHHDKGGQERYDLNRYW